MVRNLFISVSYIERSRLLYGETDVTYIEIQASLISRLVKHMMYRNGLEKSSLISKVLISRFFKHYFIANSAGTLIIVSYIEVSLISRVLISRVDCTNHL